MDGVMVDPTAIYVMEAAPLVKVGISNLPQQRVRGIQTANGQIVRIYWYRWLHGYHAKQLEWEFHKINRGKPHHANGEWYYLTPESAIAEIKRVAKLHSIKYLAGKYTAEFEQEYDRVQRKWII